MDFSQSGLPNDSLLESAFNDSFTNIMSRKDEELENLLTQVEQQIAQQMKQLNQALAMEQIDEDEFEMHKEQLERTRKAYQQQGPGLVVKALEEAFVSERLAPALIVLNNSLSASTEVMAAVLLVQTVLSPKDFLAVQAKYGPAVAGVIAELEHADVYPLKCNDTISQADAETKQAFLALTVSALEGIAEKVKEAKAAKPPQKVKLADGEEERIAGKAEAAWGTDAKLEKRFVAIFNSVAASVNSEYHAEIGNKGDLQLIKGGNPPASPSNPSKKPNKPSGPGNGTIGDGVF